MRSEGGKGDEREEAGGRRSEGVNEVWLTS